MLVVLSDLHFVDGSAGEHNLSPEAFRRVFAADVVGLARDKGIRSVDLLLLGDIFDLLRTEAWFEHPERERPWGSDRDACGRHAEAILGAILEHRDPARPHIDNPAIFRFLREELRQRLADVGVERLTIHYVPGNHDRLINAYPALRDRVAEALGIAAPAEPWWYPNAFQSDEYGVIARHGHEHDHLNCAAALDPYRAPETPEEADNRRRAYAESTSIGDVITTELAAKIPYLVRQRCDDPLLVERFQELENVRPLSGLFDFLRYQTEAAGNYKPLIESVLADTFDAFCALPYVRAYDRSHGRFDLVDKIQIAALGLRTLGVGALLRLAKSFGVLEGEDGLESGDAHIDAALREPGVRDLDHPTRFVIYGHTHGPDVVPLASPRTPDYRRIKESLYANTGTWRARHIRTRDRAAFTTLQALTYVTVFAGHEEPVPGIAGPPVLESWTGERKKYFL
ncbi:MAG: hypothetical protein H6710_03915 [Myxococcales bacterium]|nr:hypothetical protein [Myxococcales bacterium]MCB9705786.1 hypothetical protein [Myxococcales bacterium]